MKKQFQSAQRTIANSPAIHRWETDTKEDRKSAERTAENVGCDNLSPVSRASEFLRRPVTSTALQSGTSTAPIVVRSPVGYTGDEAAPRLFAHSHFVDTTVAIYARHGSDGWTYLGEYPLPREIVARSGPAGAARKLTSYIFR